MVNSSPCYSTRINVLERKRSALISESPPCLSCPSSTDGPVSRLHHGLVTDFVAHSYVPSDESLSYFQPSARGLADTRFEQSRLTNMPAACRMKRRLRFLLPTRGCCFRRQGRLRPRILVQPESKKDRRHNERGREEVWRRHAERIKRPAEE